MDRSVRTSDVSGGFPCGGFYFIAMKAQIPVLLYALDYEKKLISCTRSFIPTGDLDNEMRSIKQYYKDCKGKHPEKFTIGDDCS